MESTLSLKVSDLEAEVSLYLGYGRGAAFGDVPLTPQQQASVSSIVRSGLRQFYFPPPLEGITDSATDWSFLKPTTTLTLLNGQNSIPLPDDFGGFEGVITLLTTTGQIWGPIQLFNEAQIRQNYANTPTMSGRPLMCALSPRKGTHATQGQRWTLLVFPLPDANYPIQFTFYVLADALTGAFPYALGGMAHVETILESCLAIAEQRLDDSSSVHSQKFQERLAASISLDRRNKAQTLGYNLDRSDIRYGRWYPWNHYQDTILVNGQVPGP